MQRLPRFVYTHFSEIDLFDRNLLTPRCELDQLNNARNKPCVWVIFITKLQKLGNNS